MSLKTCFLAAMITLGVGSWRYDVLDAPPYQDQSVGWQEADFLAETHFDYRRLRYDENHWTEREQGRRNYMTSVLPTIWAALMLTFPTPRGAIIAAHWINFACSGIVVAVVFEIAATCIGRTAGFLIAGLVLTNPLFLSQTEMVGMDVPTAAFAMISLRLVLKHRFVWACLPALAAFFMKPTGSLVTAATIGYLMLWRFKGVDRDRPEARRRWLAGLITCLSVLAFEFGVVRWGGSRHWSVYDSPALATLNLTLVPWLCPDLLAIFLVGVFCTSLALYRRFQSGIPFTFSSDSIESSLAISWGVVALVILSVTRVLFIPRYLIVAIPALLLAVGAGVSDLKILRPYAFVAGVLLIGFNLANGMGSYFPSLQAESATFTRLVPDADSRSNAFLERSCEYRLEQASAILAVKEIEAKASQRPIFVGNPYTRYLTLPRLGYVSKPLEVYNANNFDDAARQLICVARLRSVPVIVWAGIARVNLPGPKSDDVVLYDDKHADPLIVYEKKFPSEFNRVDQFEDWILEETRAGPWIGARLEQRLPYLLQTGRLEQARTELNEALSQHPTTLAADPRLRRFLFEIDEARRFSRLFPNLARRSPRWAKSLVDYLTRTPSPRSGSTGRLQLGESPPRTAEACFHPLEEPLEMFERGQIEQAALILRRLADDPSDSGFKRSAVEILAVFRLLDQHPSGNEDPGLVRLLDQPDGGLLRAIRQMQRGEYDGALRDLNAARIDAPKNAEIYRWIGLIRARQNQRQSAKDAFDQALSLAPDDAAAVANRLKMEK